MKKISKVACAIALAGAMAFVLVACGGSSGSSGSGSAASESGSAVSESAASSDAAKDVYVVTKATYYQEDGTVRGATTSELDEHGNAVQQTSLGGGGNNENVMKYEFDENGYTIAMIQPDGQKVTYETTLDGDKPVKVVGSNGATTDYQYYDNGMPKEAVSQFGDEYKHVISFDENGYMTTREVAFMAEDSKEEAAMAYAWEFDESSNPVSLTVTETKVSEGTSIGALSAGAYTIECDADGNIVKVANAENGNTVIELEYTRVDNPSAFCRLNSALKSF